MNKQLAAAAAAAAASDQVSAIQAAARLLLGDDFPIVPEFTISTAQGGEWANAFNSSSSGDLFKYLKTTLNIDFPVDEWLYGAARVRPPLHSWKALVMLASAFGVAAPTLTPIQLPYEANAPWLALQFPDDYLLDSDRLALHLRVFAGLRCQRAAVRALGRRMGRGAARSHPRHGHHFQLQPSRQ